MPGDDWLALSIGAGVSSRKQPAFCVTLNAHYLAQVKGEGQPDPAQVPEIIRQKDVLAWKVYKGVEACPLAETCSKADDKCIYVWQARQMELWELDE